MVIFFSAQPSFSSDFKSLKDAKAYNDCLAKAKNGSDVAQLELGRSYIYGWWMNPDLEQALYWINKSCEQENSVAQMTLADLYFEGEYVPISYGKAFKNYMRAANNGSLDAMERVAFMYDNGIYVEKNFDEALKYYTAASKDNADAQYWLGKQNDTPNPNFDFKKAIYWYEKAANKGHFEAIGELASLYSFFKDNINTYYWTSILIDKFEVINLYGESFGIKDAKTAGNGARDKLYSLEKEMNKNEIDQAKTLIKNYYDQKDKSK